MTNLSIVIPAYNEEKRIENTLENYSDYFEKLRKEGKLDYEIIIVINNTKDRTEEIVKKFCLKNERIKYLNFRKGGKGFAITEGFKDALRRNYELIGFVDADMATSPEAFFDLVKNIEDYDLIFASRYMKESVIKPKPTLARILVSRIFNFLIKMLLFMNYKDTQCGAKLFRRGALEEVLPHITFSKWAFDVDLIYTSKKHGFKIKEFPTKWSDREYSKINFWKAGPWMFFAILRIRLLNSPFKFTLRFYDKVLNKVWKLG